MEKKHIIYIVAVVAILGAVFLSQRSYFSQVGGNFASAAISNASSYLSKGTNWAASVAYPKIGGEVQKRGEEIANQATQEKQNISEKISETSQNIKNNIQNYFSGIANSIFHPNLNNSSSNNNTTNNSGSTNSTENNTCACPVN